MSAFGPHNRNPHGVEVTPLNLQHEHAPTVQIAHGLAIVGAKGVIGRIVSWSPQPYSRNVTHIFELSHLTFGRPVDAVPGATSGHTISITRNEMWDSEIEISMGHDLYTDLADQTDPITLDEYLFKGKSGVVYRHWKYTGCWFQERNVEGFEADGEGTLRVSATMLYVARRKIK